MSPLNVARHSLGEKFHRQAKHFPHKRRTAYHIHFSVDFESVDLAYPRNNYLNNPERRQRDDKRRYPFGVFARQKSVKKNAGKCGIYDAYKRRYKRCKNNKRNGNTGTGKTLFRIRKHGLRLSARHKGLRRLKKQTDTRKRLIESFHRDCIRSFCGVVYDRFFSAKAVKHNKVIEVPMDYARELPVFA